METAGAPDPLQLRPHELSFKDLRELSDYLDRILLDAPAALGRFRSTTGGYKHRLEKGQDPADNSKASTTTCVAYLQAQGDLDEDVLSPAQMVDLRSEMIDTEGNPDKDGNRPEYTWTSAGLPDDNPFTVSFILETVLRLGGLEGDLTDDRKTVVRAKIALLNNQLRTADKDQVRAGGLRIEKYPETAFLTYKAVKVLDSWGKLDHDARKAARSWAWDHLYEESMLIDSGGPDADYFELAYLLLVASVTSGPIEISPRERQLMQYALKQFFGGQRDDGTWPRSRPLFNYPGIGYAYCYDYELLVALLNEDQLRPWTLPHLDKLRVAAWAVDARKVPVQKTPQGRTVFAWSSGHHADNSSPESWSTASVFHYCFELSKLVAAAARRDVFDYVEAPYEEPAESAPDIADALKEYVDSEVEPEEGEPFSFKDAFINNVLARLVEQRSQVADGRPFESDAKASFIFYGPPGTSKTKLAEGIADALAWPLLKLDPSHLTRKGLDNVHAEANEVFGRLELCDQVVVLMDEFDELVRERKDTGELTSRFLTTAMLPKIAALHGQRRIVYLVATNHLEVFDVAISRRGRFDVIVPVMPPTADAKLAAEPFKTLKAIADKLSGAKLKDFKKAIGPLTFDEARELQEKVKPSAPAKALEEAKKARHNCTLRGLVGDSQTGAHASVQVFGENVTQAAVKVEINGVKSDDEGEKGEADAQGDGKPAEDEEPKGETWLQRIRSSRSDIRGLDSP